MAENKNAQFGVLLVVFVVIMAVIGMLNNKISEEITGSVVARSPSVPSVAPAGETVKTDVPLEEAFKSVVAEASVADLSAIKDSPDRMAAKQEDIEVVYELPLREVELPQ